MPPVLGPDGLPLPPEQPPPPPPPSALDLAREGRALLKAKELDKAVAKMKEAVELGEKDGLPPEERGLLLYQYALALERNGQSTEAVSVLRKAVLLAPNDADIRLELSQRLLDDDEHTEAKKEAEEALRLGLEDADDQKEAARIIKKCKSELLHDRFSFYGSVAFAFDSNVLQSATRDTIAGINPNAPLKDQGITREELRELKMMLMQIALPGGFQTAIKPQQEFDLPLNLYLNVSGRLAGNKSAQLSLGYAFGQLIMFSPQRAPAPDGSGSYVKDHDSYSTQDHTATLSLIWTPASWLLLRPRFDGFANFTGLSSFAPFQGGFNAVVDATFIESSRFRTRLLYQHQLRRSFDSTNDSQLDADRDDAKLTQELRLRGTSVSARAQLSYRFRSERSGRIELYLPQEPATGSCAEPPPISSTDASLFTLCYQSTLSYMSHELYLRWRVMLPYAVEINPNFGYEYRIYTEPYRAYRSPGPRMPTAFLYEKQRVDQLINASLSINKSFPRGFSLELGYAFTKDISTIANAVDNRNYVKHVVQLTADYTF